jgi:hypothetical protein
MGVEYNQLGKSVSQARQEKEGKFVWVGDQNYTFTFLHGELVFTWIFLDNKGVLSVEA